MIKCKVSMFSDKDQWADMRVTIEKEFLSVPRIGERVWLTEEDLIKLEILANNANWDKEDVNNFAEFIYVHDVLHDCFEVQKPYINIFLKRGL